MLRPEPRDGYSADVAAAYEEGFNQTFQHLANIELQEIANEADYEENYFGKDGDYAGYDTFLINVDINFLKEVSKQIESLWNIVDGEFGGLTAVSLDNAINNGSEPIIKELRRIIAIA